MCKETKNELDLGMKAACDLTEHLIRMGAGAATIPTVGSNTKQYVVCVEEKEASDARIKENLEAINEVRELRNRIKRLLNPQMPDAAPSGVEFTV